MFSQENIVTSENHTLNTNVQNGGEKIPILEEQNVNEMESVTVPAEFQPQTPTDTPPVSQENILQPQTPTDTPPEFEGMTPDETPPMEEEEEQEEYNKQKQIERLKQTFAEVTRKKMNRQKNIFSPVIDTAKVYLKIYEVNKNVQEKIKSTLVAQLESKCNKHGLIKEGSVQIINTSSATIRMNRAEFTVTYQALACHPVEGMIVEVGVVNVTKAGIRAELMGEEQSPLVIFVARDHHNNNNYFNTIKEKDSIHVKIVGVRFELNDTYVSVIGELYRM